MSAAPANRSGPDPGPGPSPVDGRSTVERLQFRGCGQYYVALGATNEEVRNEIPDGFNPEPGLPLDMALVPLIVYSCRDVTLASRAGETMAKASEVLIGQYYFRVVPPKEYRRPEADIHSIGWAVTPNPLVARVLEEWGVGGLGDVTLKHESVGPGLVHREASFTDGPMRAHWTSGPHPAVDPLAALVGRGDSRGFGMRDRVVTGAFDEELVSAPQARQFAAYDIEGGAGFFSSRPNGAALAGDSTTMTRQLVWTVVEIPDRIP